MFCEQVVDWAVMDCLKEGSAEEKWAVVRSALPKSAKALLGTEAGHLPDRFCERGNILKSAFQQRNELCTTKWLATECADGHAQFRRVQNECR